MRTRSCRITDAELFAYAEGGLSPIRRKRIARHLDSCPACQSAIAHAAVGQRATERLRDETAAAPVPDTGFAGVMDRIRLEAAAQPDTIPASRSHSARVTFLRRLPALSVVAAAMLAFVILLPMLIPSNRAQIAHSELAISDQQNQYRTDAGPNTDSAVIGNASQDAAMAQKGALEAGINVSRLLENVKSNLAAAGITGEIHFTERDGASVLAVHFSRDVKIPTAREILNNTVQTALLPCGTLPVIAIMEGETPLTSADSPENRRIQEALGFLPRAEVSIPDSPGVWLILTWQVKD